MQTEPVVKAKTPAPSAPSLMIWTALIAVYLVWGSTYLAIRFAVETIPPFMMASARFLSAGVILYLWRRASGDPVPSKIEWRSAAIVGMFLLLGGNGGVVWAEKRVTSSVAALMVASTPLWMVLIDALRPGGKKPGVSAILGIVIGFIGIGLLIGTDLLIGSEQFTGGEGSVDIVGALVLLLAAFLWSAGSLYSRTAKLPDSPLLGTSMEMLVGGACLLLLSFATGEWRGLDVAAITTTSWLSLGYLIAFGALVGYTSYTWLLRVAPTPLVSTYAYVNPVVAVVLGYFLAAEPLTPRSLLATVIIVSAVVLTKQSSTKARSTAHIPASPQLVESAED